MRLELNNQCIFISSWLARKMMKEAGDDLAADHTTNMGKKLMLQVVIERVNLFQEKQVNGRYVKEVTFKFPVMLEGEVTDHWWYKRSPVESVVKLTRAGL